MNVTRDFKATVTWFNRESGEGSVTESHGFSYPIYARNLPGNKTKYTDTACVYLIAGEEIIVSEVHPHYGALITDPTNVYADADKWDLLDKTDLSFVCADGTLWPSK